MLFNTTALETYITAVVHPAAARCPALACGQRRRSALPCKRPAVRQRAALPARALLLGGLHFGDCACLLLPAHPGPRPPWWPALSSLPPAALALTRTLKTLQQHRFQGLRRRRWRTSCCNQSPSIHAHPRRLLRAAPWRESAPPAQLPALGPALPGAAAAAFAFCASLQAALCSRQCDF